MPKTVKLNEKTQKKNSRHASAQSKAKAAGKSKKDEESDAELAEETARRLSVEKDEDMADAGGQGNPPNVFGVEGNSREPSPYHTDDEDSDSSTTESEVPEERLAAVYDENAREILVKLLKQQKRQKEKATDRHETLFAVTKSLVNRVTEVEAKAPAHALMWPPKGWSIGDLRSLVLPEWSSGRLSSSVRGILSLSNPYEVPLVFTLADVGVFDGLKEYYQAVNSELIVVQKNGSSIAQQLRQQAALKTLLLAKQKLLLGPEARREDSWYFRTSYPQPRHMVAGDLDNSDDWSIDFLWDPRREIFRTLLQCVYNHNAMSQKFRIDLKVIRDMAGPWTKEAILLCVDQVARMYRFEVEELDALDPELEPLGKNKAKPSKGVNGQYKGSGSRSNGSYVNRGAYQQQQVEDVTPPQGKGVIPGVGDVGLPNSFITPPPPPVYAMAKGTGKSTYLHADSKHRGHQQNSGNFGKPSGPKGGGGQFGGYGGGFGSGKFGGKQRSGGFGKGQNNFLAPEVMQQIASLLAGGASY